MRSSSSWAPVVPSLLLASITAACGGDGEGPVDVTTVPPSYLGLQMVSGNAQEGPPGSSLARSLVVRVRAHGPGTTAVGQRIVWVVESGGGSLTADTVWSDGGGESRTEWQLGPDEGNQSVRAYLTASPSEDVTFTAVAVEAVEDPVD